MHRPASGSAGFIQRRAESSGTSNSSAASVTLPPVHLALHQQETLPPSRKNASPPSHRSPLLTHGYYYAHINPVDAEIGRLLDVLDETGAADDTIVVYTSDQGEMMGSHNWMGKRLPYEESAKVPFVARFPGRIPAAKTTDALLGAIDLYPTLCGLASVAPPEHCAGRDLSAALRGKQHRRPEHAFLMHQNVKGVDVLIHRGLRTPRYTYAAGERGRWLLFDNQEDPYQRHNLAGDPARSGLVRELEGEILEYLEVTGDPNPFAERVRPHA